MTPPMYTIVRDMDPELVDAQFTTDDPLEADELLEMVHAHRPWARVTIYDEEGRILRRVKPRNWVDEAEETTCWLPSRRIGLTVRLPLLRHPS